MQPKIIIRTVAPDGSTADLRTMLIPEGVIDINGFLDLIVAVSHIYDPAYTTPNFTPATTRFTVGSLTTQLIPSANNFIGTDSFHSITPQNTTSKTFIGERNALTLNGSSSSGSGTNLIGYLGAVSSTWAPSGSLASVWGIATTVDVAANAGATEMVGGRFRTLVGSVNVGAVTRLVGVDAYANYGYAATITDTIGVSASTQSASDFGGTTTNVKLFNATKSTTNSDVTNFYAFYAGNYSGGTAPITNNYGIFLDSTIDQGTNRWAIKSDSTALSEFAGDVEVNDTTKGIILKSPNGTRWRLKVDNSGALSTEAA